MVKHSILQVLVIFSVIASARKRQQKLAPDIVATDEMLERILLQKQLFQDIFSERQANNKLQFGHVCENPLQWEQRFEEKDFMNNRYRGKVKWGNVDGAYGEQYWDLNHK